MVDLEEACQVLHEAYERAAVRHDWRTNPASRVPWADVPEANKATMRLAVDELLTWMWVAPQLRPVVSSAARLPVGVLRVDGMRDQFDLPMPAGFPASGLQRATEQQQ